MTVNDLKIELQKMTSGFGGDYGNATIVDRNGDSLTDLIQNITNSRLVMEFTSEKEVADDSIPWCEYCQSWHGPKAEHIKVRTIVDSLAGIKVEIHHDYAVRSVMNWAVDEWQHNYSAELPLSPMHQMVLTNGINAEDRGLILAAIDCITGVGNVR